MPIILVASHTFDVAGTTSVAADRRDIAAAVDATPRGAPIVLLCADEDAWSESRAVRLAYGRHDIGLLRCEIPTTALFVVVTALAIFRDRDLSLAGALSDLVSRATSTYVLMSSVTNLDRPTPSLVQHVASLWPPSRFVVDWSEQRVTRAETIPPVDGRVAVIARSAKPIDTFDEASLPVERVEVELGSGPGPWRAARWVEVTTLHEWLEDIVAYVLDPTENRNRPTCRSCDRVGWGQLCVFCQLPLVESSLVPVVATSGGPA